MRLERNSRKLIKLLEANGWYSIATEGSHHHFRHPALPEKVTVPHPNKDIALRTVKSVYRQAGWLTDKDIP